MTEPKLVTIGVPIYKRLEYLPNVLMMVASQDYPSIELLVSDNGENNGQVSDMVRRGYSRPFRVRQNAKSVDLPTHFNQIVNEARGAYFIMLNDDDEISANYVSELVTAMERFPNATLGFGRQEIIDRDGAVLRSSVDKLPEVLSGEAFVRVIWKTYELGFRNVESFVADTRLLQETGGYAHCEKGNHSDDAAVLRLCLGNSVVFSSKCTYRHRVHAGGFGWQASVAELAAASREFLDFIKKDRTIRRYARAHPAEWQELKRILVRMTWETYLWRWRDWYKQKLSTVEWAAAGFALPFIPAYYRSVAKVLGSAGKSQVRHWLGGAAGNDAPGGSVRAGLAPKEADRPKVTTQ